MEAFHYYAAGRAVYTVVTKLQLCYDRVKY